MNTKPKGERKETMTKNSARLFDGLTRQFRLSKTLRFELIPQGRTAETIKKENLIGRSEEDKLEGSEVDRNEHYKEIKQLLDAMHRRFLDDALDLSKHSMERRTELSEEILRNHAELMDGKKDRQITSKVLPKLFNETIQRWRDEYKRRLPELLNKEIAELKTKQIQTPQKAEYYARVIARLEKKIKKIEKTAPKFSSAKSLYTETEPPLEMLEWVLREGWIDQDLERLDMDKNQALRSIIPAFDSFSTYLTGYNENRANVYDAQSAKKTSILHRTYVENLTFYADNSTLLKQMLDRREKLLRDHPDLSLPDIAELHQMLEREEATLDDLLKIENYIPFMNQSGIDRYNRILGGGIADAGKVRSKGINQFIKETRDAAGAKSKDFPMLHPLYKQILSLREEKSYAAKYSTDQELLNDLKSITTDDPERFTHFNRITGTFLDDLNPDDLNTLKLTEDQLRILSAGLFGGEGWFVLLSRAQPPNTKKKSQKIKLNLSCFEADTRARNTEQDDHRLQDEFKEVNGNLVIAYLKSALTTYGRALETARTTLLQSGILDLDALDTRHRDDVQQGGGKQIAIIKAYLDARNDMAGFVKKWKLDDKLNKNELAIQWNAGMNRIADDQTIFPLYNRARNYLTQKRPPSENIRITFQAPTFLNGWDQNREQANLGILLERDGLYYLGVLHPKHKKLLDYAENDKDSPKAEAAKTALREEIYASAGEAAYRKMTYKLLPDPGKMLPKVFFSKMWKETKFAPPAQILDIVESKRHKTDPRSMAALIDYYREALPRYPGWRCYHFTPNMFKPGIEYRDINEFFDEVSELGYQITFDNIRTSYIDRLVEEGKPCPVCGSLQHPAPAAAGGELPDPAELRRQKLQAEELAKLADNIVVKVPMIKDGIKAIKWFDSEGIRTNCTLVFSAGQAILAAKAGATYLSPFVGRVDDITWDGIKLIEEIAAIYSMQGYMTEILAASIRSPLHIVQAAKAGADVVTCPLSSIMGLLNHPLTDIGLKKFLEDHQKSLQG